MTQFIAENLWGRSLGCSCVTNNHIREGASELLQGADSFFSQKLLQIRCNTDCDRRSFMPTAITFYKNSTTINQACVETLLNFLWEIPGGPRIWSLMASHQECTCLESTAKTALSGSAEEAQDKRKGCLWFFTDNHREPLLEGQCGMHVVLRQTRKCCREDSDWNYRCYTHNLCNHV